MGRQENRLSGADDGAQSEVRIPESAVDQVEAYVGLGRVEAGSGRTGSEAASSNGKRGPGKWSRMSVIRVAPVLGTKTW